MSAHTANQQGHVLSCQPNRLAIISISAALSEKVWQSLLKAELVRDYGLICLGASAMG